MSKLLNEEQIEELANKLFPELGWGHPDDKEIWAKQDGFKVAFSLLMPIIEKQMEALEDIAPIYYDSSDPNGFTPDETIAWRTIQETKQMLEKELEEVK